jgi:hypothetical protein
MWRHAGGHLVKVGVLSELDLGAPESLCRPAAP